MSLVEPRGRVEIHEANVFRRSPVPDNGIDLRRGRGRGISGYEANRRRLEALKARRAAAAEKMLAEAIAAREREPLPPFDFSKPSIIVIQKYVSAISGVRINDILSDRRSHPIIRAKHIAMMLSKMLTKKSYPEIGRQFGGRDHTTVLATVRKTETIQARLAVTMDETMQIDLWVTEAFKAWDELGL